jgi:hypothetical protein
MYEGKPRGDQVDGLVDEFEVNQEFAREAVRRPICVMELTVLCIAAKNEPLSHLRRCETNSGT